MGGSQFASSQEDHVSFPGRMTPHEGAQTERHGDKKSRDNLVKTEEQIQRKGPELPGGKKQIDGRTAQPRSD